MAMDLERSHCCETTYASAQTAIYLHLSTSTIKFMSVLSFLTWSRLATVVIGTY